MEKKTLVLLIQLGSPKSPEISDVRSYLRDFLSDRRVIDINPIVWKIILNCFVLPFRPKKSAALYKRIWDGESFPLLRNTEAFADKVNSYTGPNLEVRHGYLLSSPNFRELLEDWNKRRDDYERIIVIPQFPQYAEATIASGYDVWNRALDDMVVIPSFEFVSHYHCLKAFIDLTAQKINREIKNYNNFEFPVKNLILTFHGIPLRRVLEKEDPYYQHSYETFELLKERITAVPKENIHLCFQSRFGSEVWLGPYTDEFAVNLIKEDPKQTIAVHSPSFVVDCLETIDELGTELTEEIEGHGGKNLFIGSLNSDDDWAESYAEYIEALNKRESDKLFYDAPKVPKRPELSEDAKVPMDKSTKSTLKIVFLTLFLDLVGFSIIFPMFPALAEYYLDVDGNNYFLRLIFDSISGLLSQSEASSGFTPIVLFGGALGALYSILQFFAAPLWGGISDRIGRRPSLLISVAGLALSYLLWGFSGSFTLLILARFIGGIMGGNISIASAVVADVTDTKNRSKGMAYIGIAFALGFIIGPALGGVFSLINLIDIYPALESFGINPFSVPAFFAFVLSMINLWMIFKNLEETNPELNNRSVQKLDDRVKRSVNPLTLFKPLPIKSVNYTNLGYFFFISAFSGMEFTLTFLAVERLNYSPLDNGFMFIFIGLVLALVQGGFVRRRASDIGEKKVALIGMVATIPGLVLIGHATNSFTLYFGLFFLAIGSAMIIPCLTALVSILSPSNLQGQALGIFRSLGALGRVIGPLAASLIYWKYGSKVPYLIGAISILLPLAVLKMVKVEPISQE